MVAITMFSLSHCERESVMVSAAGRGTAFDARTKRLPLRVAIMMITIQSPIQVHHQSARDFFPQHSKLAICVVWGRCPAFTFNEAWPASLILASGIQQFPITIMT
jgi:hypothetical protein